ncbi:hypothetical protein [Halococcus thailandensis]|jgi:hypothetical protein|uniref:Uncharacterized protein n=1 Tax=Halococcus thailandensis JCM 13552 TaxID=1227457 RepID=M0MW05_9EURY|nr:hypothetical protein [Halococcus thailandensis]EMA48984.1 hypothetical protein C451_19708 [Halococcus thailandensis JCM 13552]
MTQKTIGQNTGRSGRVNLSGPELDKFDAEVSDSIKVDIAESKEIAKAIIENSVKSEFVIVSKPEVDSSSVGGADE